MVGFLVLIFKNNQSIVFLREQERLLMREIMITLCKISNSSILWFECDDVR